MTRSSRRTPRRALRGVLSIAAILMPAAGIAYLGAVSYKEDRGLIAAKLDEQYRAAAGIARAVEGQLNQTLDAVAFTLDPKRRPDEESSPLGWVPAVLDLAERYPLASAPFRIARDGHLDIPATSPLRRRPSGEDFLSREPTTCPERGFDSCISAIRAAQRRARQLDQARLWELGERTLLARRLYAQLARFEDTGPDALLALARLESRAGRPAAAQRYYEELATRFGSRLDVDGVSYGLLADLGAIQLTPEPRARLTVYRSLLMRVYEAPSALLDRLVDRLGEELSGVALDPSEAAEFAELRSRLGPARMQARFATGLSSEVDEIARTATERAHGRPALSVPSRTLVYRRERDGSIVGVIVDKAMLERAAASAPELGRFASGTRAVIEQPGDAVRRAGQMRTLITTGFGPILPHLTVALVSDLRVPDPLDEIIRARGQRHLAITGGLVVVLLIGLIATIRGAARERELARLKSDFVSTVSHELKTPLTSIRMFGEMLQQGVAGDDRERETRYHGIIVKESQRLGLLIANLLDYSQIERGTRRYSTNRVRAAELADEAVETFQRFREDHVPIALQFDDDRAEILADREVVVQSLLNLLGNAAKYGQPPITVAVGQQGDEVTLAVTDQGPGIPASEHERIFQEFYRAPAAYSSGVEGTGLGLALVKRHVEAQGGTVRVTSVPGGGATFTIAFPRC